MLQTALIVVFVKLGLIYLTVEEGLVWGLQFYFSWPSFLYGGLFCRRGMSEGASSYLIFARIFRKQNLEVDSLSLLPTHTQGAVSLPPTWPAGAQAGRGCHHAHA